MTPEDLKAFQVVTFNKRLRRFQQTPVKRAPVKTDEAADPDAPDAEDPASADDDLPDLTTQALPQ